MPARNTRKPHRKGPEADGTHTLVERPYPTALSEDPNAHASGQASAAPIPAVTNERIDSLSAKLTQAPERAPGAAVNLSVVRQK